MKKIKPVGDRVLVAPLTEAETSASGIILPDTVEKEKKAEGKVVAIGDGDDIKKLKLKENDIVIFGKYSGEDVEIDGTDYKILKDDEVLAVIE